MPGSALTIVESPRNGAPGDRELRRELPEAEVLGALADQAEGRDVPERRRPAVAEDDLVALGQRESWARPSRTSPTSARTGAWRWEVPSTVRLSEAR